MKDNLLISEKEKEALINYLSGELSESESEVLNSWLHRDHDNRLLFDQLSDIWQASQYSKINKKIDVQAAWNDLQKQFQPKLPNSINWNRWLQIAAIIVLSLILGGLGGYFINKDQNIGQKSQLVEYVSPLGSRSFIKLNDGSKVWLNSGTTIKYNNAFGVDNRNIELSGEAFFEVEKNKKLPFVVNTSEIIVTAIGTKFDVKAYEEENTIETTLIEGLVKLESDVVKLQNNIVLKTNEKAVFTKKNQSVEIIGEQLPLNDVNKAEMVKPSLEIIQSVDPVPIVSWKDKRWTISNEKLGSLSVKLERRFDVNFIFDNELLKEYSFRGTLEDETLDQILNVISLSAPINYVIDSKTVYIMPDGKQMEKFKMLMGE